MSPTPVSLIAHHATNPALHPPTHFLAPSQCHRPKPPSIASPSQPPTHLAHFPEVFVGQSVHPPTSLLILPPTHGCISAVSLPPGYFSCTPSRGHPRCPQILASDKVPHIRLQVHPDPVCGGTEHMVVFLNALNCSKEYSNDFTTGPCKNRLIWMLMHRQSICAGCDSSGAKKGIQGWMGCARQWLLDRRHRPM